MKRRRDYNEKNNNNKKAKVEDNSLDSSLNNQPLNLNEAILNQILPDTFEIKEKEGQDKHLEVVEAPKKLVYNLHTKELNLANLNLENNLEYEISSVENHTNITTLDLSNTRIKYTEIGVLKKILVNNTTLVSLNLSNNPAITDKGVKEIISGLKGNSTLIDLNLSHTGLVLKNFPTISRDLTKNFTLQSLDISKNGFHGRAFGTFIKCLPSSITTLNLYDTNIKNQPLKNLASRLNTTLNKLTSLDLGYNPIEKEGFLAFKRALESNTALKYLSFEKCTQNLK